MISAYISDIILLLVAAVLIVPLFQSVGLGTVPGFLMAGIIVGPSGLGLIVNIEDISHFSEIGVVLLLFIIGIELKPSRLRLMRRLVFGLGTLQVVASGIVFTIIIIYFFAIPIQTAIFIGPALALSSTAFVVQLLKEQKVMMTEYGRTSFSVLLLQDLAVVPLLALIPLLANPDFSIASDIGIALAESLAILFLIIFTARYFLHPILHHIAITGSPEVFTASAVLIVLGTAAVTEHIGLSMGMGAFLAGLLISDSAFRHQILAEIQPFSGLLLGMFFVCMGMSVNLKLFYGEPLFFVALTLSIILIKTCILWIICIFFGLPKKISLAVSLILAQSGEFALVIFSLAFKTHLLDETLFHQLMLLVLLSMIFTPLLANLAYKFSKKHEATNPPPSVPPINAPIIIAGFGRTGQRIGEILTLAGQPFAALDINPDLVRTKSIEGHLVIHGDACNPEILHSLDIKNVRLVIVTLNDADAAEDIVSSVHSNHPNTNIIVKGHGLAECKKLRHLGASVAISENIEASLELTRVAMSLSGIDHKEQEAILVCFKRSYYTKINNKNNSKA